MQGSDESQTRERILSAAFRILHDVGVKKLTQSQVAKAAGVRQSHLTYYFPRKVDLVAAVVDRFTETAMKKLASLRGRDEPAEVIGAISRLATDPAHMRIFLGLVVEADSEPAIRDVLAKHVAEFSGRVAVHLGRAVDDPGVHALLDAIRGRGMRRLLTRREQKDDASDLAELLGFSARRTRKPR